MSLEFLHEMAKKRYEELVAIRRKIHEHPELDFECEQTALLIEKKLDEVGIQHFRVTKTGVVGVLRGRKEGKTVAFRADMDGLPVCEGTKALYSSKIEGKMHACGHDVHVASLLGAAGILAESRNTFDGTVKFFFQPAEETDGGALPMISEGVMENPLVDGVFCLHCDPQLSAGSIGVGYGKFRAASDMFHITIHGKGSHGAQPHRGIDAIAIGSEMISALQQIVSRRTSPFDPVVVTVGSFHGGTAGNIIAEEVEMRGIVRTMDPDTRLKVRALVRCIAQNIPDTLGAVGEVVFTEGYPSLINDESMTDLVADVGREVLGREKVFIMKEPEMGVDDFAYFLQKAPGSYFVLGTGNKERDITYPLHSPFFDVDEQCLPVGASVLAAIALRFLSKP
ncbi:M20 metallopeptidase family protein [Aminobacterium sp. UBA5514]|uniref:M20 metallopeptidase family protein n=1 Tax=Aminobacterium sp. UBA5514 TaxID=1946036 RepID=UPI00257E772A|nr:amidohydrolase [Aminobacterium sp. UBA5514]